MPDGDEPLLASLTVSPGVLSPAFEPDQRDYGVVCAQGANDLVVAATPVDDGATVGVIGADRSGHVAASEDDVIIITVNHGDRPEGRYYVRCLPHDFPPLQVERSAPGNAPGWYLFTTFASFPVGPPFFVVVLDDHGAVLWYKRTEVWSLDVKQLPNGNLFWHNSPAAAYEERTLEGALVRTWSTVGVPTDPHDSILLPDGNMLIGSAPRRSGVDVSVLAPAFTGVTDVLDAWFQEIKPDGTVVWEWHSEDHIGIEELTVHLDGVTLTANPLDLVHWNSIELDPDGNLVMSARHNDAVYKIRRNPGQPDDGDILWKLGGNAPTEPGARHLTIVDDPYAGLARQHDARLLADGHLTVFDNRTARTADVARGVEYEIDEQAGTATLMWEQRGPGGPSCCMGSMRRGSDGSSLVAWGGADPIFTEYAADGTVVFEVAADIWSYRAVKVPVGGFDRDELRALGGGTAAP